MPRAIWHDTVIADSPDTVVVEGNHYFPPESVDREHVTTSEHHTVCPWKGTASYLTVRVGEEESPDAAWYYPEPKPKAEQIRDHVAFWKDVRVEE